MDFREITGQKRQGWAGKRERNSTALCVFDTACCGSAPGLETFPSAAVTVQNNPLTHIRQAGENVHFFGGILFNVLREKYLLAQTDLYNLKSELFFTGLLTLN